MQTPTSLRVSGTTSSLSNLLSQDYRFKDQDDRSDPMLHFLLWVAYDQILAEPNQIPDDVRLRCPIMRCRKPFHDQNELLKHVFRCAKFSNGQYWCFHCQTGESFAPFQIPAFRSLSVRAKRIFRWLGTKGHHKDHESSHSSSPSKRISGLINNRCSAYTTDYVEASPVPAELDNSRISRELEGDYNHAPAELHGCGSPTVELYSEIGRADTFELEAPYAVNKGTGLSSEYPSIDSFQTLPASSFDFDEPPLGQFHMKNTAKPAMSEERLPRLQSPVSPQSTGWMPASYAEAISESPTDTDFSGHSIFTKSFESEISPPSTRNSTMQSFSQSTSSVDEPSECPSCLPDIPNIMYEVPSDILEEKFTGERLSNGKAAGALDPLWAPERHDTIRLGTSDWHNPKDILHEVWKILRLQIVESSVKLKGLPSSSVIDELLSMTAEKIVYTGLSVWRRKLEGHGPATIAHLYALVHLGYAFAMVTFDGQVGDHLEGFFTQSLAIEAGALSDEDRLTYTNIVSSIWSPPSSDMHRHPGYFADPYGQADRARTGQQGDKGKSKPYVINVNERFVRSPYVEEVPCTWKENEILSVLAHFLDSKSESAPSLTLPVDTLNSLRWHHFLHGRASAKCESVKGYYR
jgi:hypothetical protein